MLIVLEDFRRLLQAVLQDPARADLLVEAVARVGVSGEMALQKAVTAELERAITLASVTSLPFGRKLDGRTRIDILMLSPGGVVLKGRYHGKSILSELLNSKIDEGRALGVLAAEPFASNFALVRDGKVKTHWFDFEHGQAGFAAVHSSMNAEPFEKPDSLFAIFITADKPEETRHDPVPCVAPIALAKLYREVDPAKAKTPRAWISATPDRRIFRLRDGRAMSTRWYGAPGAIPVIVFGAIHKSTTADAFLANAAIAYGLALLVVERPGLGISDPMRNASYQSVSEDVAEVCRALDLSEAFVYGVGMASSFAMATANRMGSTVKAIALSAPRVGRPSGEAPSAYGRILWAMLQNPYGIDVLARLLRQMRLVGPANAIMQSFSVNNARDKKILHEMGMLDYMTAQIRDAFDKTVEGALAEFRLYQSGARFDPGLVKQPIRIFLGAEDRTILREDTERAFAEAPNVRIETIPGAGVLMDQNEANMIVRWLTDGWRAQAPERTIHED